MDRKPRRTRLLLAAGLALVVAAAAGVGYWHVQEAARQTVDEALARFGLADRLSYARVIHNPLTGATTLHGVTAVLPAQLGHAPTVIWDRIQISDVRHEGELLRSVRLRGEGHPIDAVDAARPILERDPHALTVPFEISSKWMLEKPVAALLVLGYRDTLRSNFDIDYRYDPGTGSLSLHAAFEQVGMAVLSFDLVLVDVDAEILRALAEAVAELRSPVTGDFDEALQKHLRRRFDGREPKQFQLADLQLAYEDRGLLRRLKSFEALQELRRPGEPGRLSVDQDDLKGAVTLAQIAGIPPERAAASARAVSAFINDLRPIRLVTGIEGSIPLFPRGQFLREANFELRN